MTSIFLSFTAAVRENYYGEKALAGLRALGDVRLHEGPEALDSAGLIDAARGCQVIVSDRNTAGTKDLFAASPQLAVFMRCAMDIRNVDVMAASSNGILVTHASAGFMTSVTEWVLGALIDLSRGISDSVLAYRAGLTPPVRMGRELRGSTLGVIGFGQIGRQVGDLGLAMGMRVLVSDPHATVDNPAMKQTSLEELLAASDNVVCLAPALPQTENMMDDQRFAQMKRGALFVNASRGNLVDEAALLRALDSGHLAGCALDVGRAPDQMPSPALAQHPHAIATPHIGGLTRPAVEHQAMETVSQLAELLRGGIPVGAVNVEQASRLDVLRSGRSGSS